jgi:hypothetical protein
VGIHALLAERTNTPELAMEMDEGKQFMTAAQNVMRHYSVETTQKTLDIIAFCGVTAQLYMPRIAAITIRKKTEGMQNVRRPNGGQPQQQPNNVTPFVPMVVAGEPDMGING